VEQRRRRIEGVLNTILSASDEAGTPASLVFFDIDRFSSLNKWYGTEICDHVITVVEHEINQALPGGVVERIGGDELLVCLSGKTLAQAARMAGDVVTRIKGYHWSAIAPNLYCTISAGVAHYNAGRPVQDWIVRAIQGAVDAKKSGGNRVSKGPLGMPAYLSLAYEVMLSLD
jgi:diguanylate cyclase (GGDEF)-like protein